MKRLFLALILLTLAGCQPVVTFNSDCADGWAYAMMGAVQLTPGTTPDGPADPDACPDCNGTGRLPGDGVVKPICPRCNGTGKIGAKPSPGVPAFDLPDSAVPAPDKQTLPPATIEKPKPAQAAPTTAPATPRAAPAITTQPQAQKKTIAPAPARSATATGCRHVLVRYYDPQTNRYFYRYEQVCN